MPGKPPGVEGLGVKTRIDKGTMMRNASPKPGIIGSGRTLEGISQSAHLTRSLANSDIDHCLVAIVYFKTDEHKVHNDDRIGLQNLVKSLNDRLKEGFKISLRCIGGADYRHKIGYNLRLGQRRADSVETEIKRMVQNKGLKIFAKAVEEKYALQPKGGKFPSLRSIVNDRHVKVIIDKNGYIAPIFFDVTGNWDESGLIAEKELNLGGKFASTHSTNKERKEQERYGNKRNANDPFLPTVIIKTNFSIKKVNGKDEGFIKCEVIYVKTKKILFTVSENTISNKVIKEKTYIGSKKWSRIERVIVPGHTSPKDSAEGRPSKDIIVKKRETTCGISG